MVDGYNFAGRVAIVTGGSEGIGKATATLLARYGANVVIAGRTVAKLEEAAAEISDLAKVRCIAVPTDAQDEDEVRRLVRQTMDQLGRIDVLINNVGWSDRGPIKGLSYEDWRKEFSRNLDTAFFGTRHVVEHMRAHGGAIVNTSSTAGVDGVQGLAAYSSAKAALQMFTRVSAAEFGSYNIRVNAVAPGFVATENATRDLKAANVDIDAICASRPLRRAGKPVDIAQAIVFLASDAASYISGETLQVTGGPVVGGSAD